MSGYDVMLFPTYYEGEGFPGAVLDCYVAGVPVIASDWRYNAEVIEEGETGLLFPAKNQRELEARILDCVENGARLEHMKCRAYERAKEYHVDVVMPKLLTAMRLA